LPRYIAQISYIAHLGIPEIWAIARKDEFAQKSIFRCGKGDIFFEEEMATLAKEISSLKRRWPHWQRRYLL
jgi:hypothetical protein